MNRTPHWYIRERTITPHTPAPDHIAVEAVLFVNGPDGWEEKGRRTSRAPAPDYPTHKHLILARKDLIARYRLDLALELTEEEVNAGDY